MLILEIILYITHINIHSLHQILNYEYTNKNEVGRMLITDDSSVTLDTLYSYDQYGRPSSAEIGSMAGSPAQSYSYDSLGRTSKISNEYSSDSTVEQNISYVVNGSNQTGRIDTVSYQKNSAGTVTNIIPSLSYEFDANGNITHIYENGVLKIRYHYDGLNRLSREDNSDIDKTVVYSYDKFGNIRSKVEYELSFGELGTAINTVPYRYQSGGGAATKYGDETINYDLDGNMQNYRGYTMTWAKGRQLSALSGNGLTMSFKYDNNSIRTKKTVNGVETEYFYVGDTLVSQKTGNEVINFAYTAGGTPYGFTYNGTSYFYLTNIQGDIIGIYNTNGNVVVEYTYDSWGKLISITGSLADTIGVKNPLRYRGYYYDTETSLYYLQARYYDPDICRFISADALLVAGNDYIQGMNRYAYCYNNPVMYSDPSGYAPFWTNLLNWILNLSSFVFDKNYGETDESFFDIWTMFLAESESIGFSFSGGEADADIRVLSSGVVKVEITITNTYLNDKTSKGDYIIEMYYGNSSEWAVENKAYDEQSFAKGILATASSLFVTLMAPPLGGLMTAIGIGVALNPDEYKALIDDMVIASSGSQGINYCAILYIKDMNSDAYIYQYKGG